LAYTYLEIVNEVLSEMNEVLLTSSTFTSARNIQRHVKEAVNRAYFDVNNPEHKWPWLSVGAPIGDRYGNVEVDLVDGQRWYDITSGASDINGVYGHIDWEKMELTTEGVVGETAPYINKRLNYISQEDWMDHLYEKEMKDETDQSIGAEPRYVIENHDGTRFGVSPIPDKAYKLYFYAWTRPVRLENHDSPVVIPDQYVHVLIARARYYAWQRKEQPQNVQAAYEEYKAGLKGMRQQTIDAAPEYMSDSRIRFV